MTLTLPPRHKPLLAIFIAVSFILTLVCTDNARAQGGQMTGAQTHLLWHRWDDADVDLQMDKAKAAGAGILRVDVGWASIEQDGKGKYNEWYLKKLDAVVDGAEARGLKLLLTFWETPCWASSAPSDIKGDCSGSWWDRKVQRWAPRDASDYADALSFVVSRYRGRVAAWEIWNEPNHDTYFRADNVVARYAQLIRAGYPAAKAADPRATILAGSLADADFAFTQKLLDRGVGGYFDAWSVHPYSGDRSPLDPGPDEWIQNSFIRGVPRVRQTLLAAGQNKPIWLTEFGWSSCTYRGGPSYKNCVSFERQAHHLRQAFRQMRSWSYVPVGIWFNIIDTSDEPDDRLENYGLLRHNGSEKPAFHAFAAMSRDLGGGTLPEPPPGPTPPGDTASEVIDNPAAPVSLRVVRKRKAVVVRGSAPRHAVVRIRVYRYLRPLQRFAERPSYTVRLRANKSGRYKRTLRKPRLRRGRWRITAAATRGEARTARVLRGSRR